VRWHDVSIKTTMEELATYMRGWRGYFGFCQMRAALWRQWKTPRRRRAALIALGVRGELCNMAGSGHGPWHLARSKLAPTPTGIFLVPATTALFDQGNERSDRLSRRALRFARWSGHPQSQNCRSRTHPAEHVAQRLEGTSRTLSTGRIPSEALHGQADAKCRLLYELVEVLY
jgi:hypothetical protein